MGCPKGSSHCLGSASRRVDHCREPSAAGTVSIVCHECVSRQPQFLASASSRVCRCRQHVCRLQSTASQIFLTDLCMAGAVDAAHSCCGPHLASAGCPDLACSAPVSPLPCQFIAGQDFTLIILSHACLLLVAGLPCLCRALQRGAVQVLVRHLGAQQRRSVQPSPPSLPSGPPAQAAAVLCAV